MNFFGKKVNANVALDNLASKIAFSAIQPYLQELSGSKLHPLKVTHEKVESTRGKFIFTDKFKDTADATYIVNMKYFGEVTVEILDENGDSLVKPITYDLGVVK